MVQDRHKYMSEIATSTCPRQKKIQQFKTLPGKLFRRHLFLMMGDDDITNSAEFTLIPQRRAALFVKSARFAIGSLFLSSRATFARSVTGREVLPWKHFASSLGARDGPVGPRLCRKSEVGPILC